MPCAGEWALAHWRGLLLAVQAGQRRWRRVGGGGWAAARVPGSVPGIPAHQVEQYDASQVGGEAQGQPHAPAWSVLVGQALQQRLLRWVLDILAAGLELYHLHKRPRLWVLRAGVLVVPRCSHVRRFERLLIAVELALRLHATWRRPGRALRRFNCSTVAELRSPGARTIDSIVPM